MSLQFLLVIIQSPSLNREVAREDFLKRIPRPCKQCIH